MGQSKNRRETFLAENRFCIFCGGSAPATTQEHCPPRALFRDRAWPKGYVFPACEACNGGTSDDDLLVAFLANLDLRSGAHDARSKGFGLMKRVHRRFPGLLQSMMDLSPIEARATARRLGMTPAPGQTHQQLGIANVTPEMHAAVATLAGKLVKAIYFKQTGRVFPAGGGIMFHWFTNAQRLEHGKIPALEVLKGTTAMSTPKERGGKDLKEQFDYLYSADSDGTLHVLQVVFGVVFGFVCFVSQTPGRLEAIHDHLCEQHEGKPSPFTFVSTNR